MMGSVKKMEFEGDIADTLGGFVAIIMMPFTYSIANGIMFGTVSYTHLDVYKRQPNSRVNITLLSPQCTCNGSPWMISSNS